MSDRYKFRMWDKELRTMISPELFDSLLDGREVAYSAPVTKKVPSKTTKVPFIDLANGARGEKTWVEEWLHVTETRRMKTYKGNPFAMKNVVIMQFTGLIDRNSEKVYEGDILALGRVEDGSKEPLLTVEMKITVDDRGIRCKWGYPDEHNYHAPYWVTAIGNIYENPELLSGA